MQNDTSAPAVLHPLLQERWSPRAFDPVMPPADILMRLFEAARWAPSSMNEQPWRFILGLKNDASWQNIYGTLVEFNKLWAHTAPVLVLNICRNDFSKNETFNPTAQYDLGQAVAYFTMQAMHEGLFVHQMGGFEVSKARQIFKVPQEFSIVSVMAVGYMGNYRQLPDKLKQMELRTRQRNGIEELVYSDVFGHTALFE